MKRVDRMMLLASALVMGALVSIGWPQPSPQHANGSELIAAGSGVNLGITRALAEAFMRHHAEIRIEIPGSIGTKGAIKATADGAIAIGLISRPLTDEEAQLPLRAVPYARTAIVVGANASVTDEAITFEDLVDIYKGTRTRWSDGHEILVQTREQGDSGFLVLEREIPGFREAVEESRQAKRWSVFFTDQDANRALSTQPGGIGVTDLGMISTEKLNVKVLKLNGLVPTPENILSGRYPLVRQLSFIHRKDDSSEAVKAFLAFVRSDEGAKILQSHGYVPE